MSERNKAFALWGVGLGTLAAIGLNTRQGSRRVDYRDGRYGLWMGEKENREFVGQSLPWDIMTHRNANPDLKAQADQTPALMGSTFAVNPMISYRQLWEPMVASYGLTDDSRSLNVNRFSEADRARLAAWEPNLYYYDLILVNTSGGKDSAAMIAKICQLTKDPRLQNRMIAIHSDLGEAEHPMVKQVVKQHGRRTHMPVVIIEPTIKGQLSGLIEQVQKRAKSIEREEAAARAKGATVKKKKHAAPGFSTRYCTSALKTGNIKKWLNSWITENFGKGNLKKKFGRRVRILNLLGLRAGESESRSKAGFKYKAGYTNKTRMVTHEWLPIQFYNTNDVWEAIRLAQLPYHSAYQVGFGRLSCSICPLAGRDDLALGMMVYPELAQKMFALEDRYGFKWKETASAKEIFQAAKNNPALMQRAKRARQELRLREGGPRMWLSTQTVGGSPIGRPYIPQG